MGRPIHKLPENYALFRIVNKWEERLLCLLLLAMILLACSQIILRTFFSGGMVWADQVVRYLVLWCGLFGAVAATGQGKHIALDLIPGHLVKSIAPYLTLVTHIFATCAASGLTYASWLFLQSEMEFGGPGPLSLPLWVWNLIFPLAFGLMSLKYLVLSALQMRQLTVVSRGHEGHK